MRFLSKELDLPNEEYYEVLNLPVPYENTQRFQFVPMTNTKEKTWTVVDFTKEDAPDGIYTKGLAACCACVLIQRDEQGDVKKIWMQHLAGGLSTDGFADFPTELTKDQNVEVIIQYGRRHDPSEYKIFHAQEIIRETFDIGEEQLHIFFNYAGEECGEPGSILINKYGTVGQIEQYDILSTGNATLQISPIISVRGKANDRLSLDLENCRFKEIIKIVDSCIPQIILYNVLNYILDDFASEAGEEKAALALKITREYLSKSNPTGAETLQYFDAMSSIDEKLTEVTPLINQSNNLYDQVSANFRLLIQRQHKPNSHLFEILVNIRHEIRYRYGEEVATKALMHITNFMHTEQTDQDGAELRTQLLETHPRLSSIADKLTIPNLNTRTYADWKKMHEQARQQTSYSPPEEDVLPKKKNDPFKP